jgi:riboflavin-specific deaminase-like protein
MNPAPPPTLAGDDGGPLVIAQLGQSLDGRIATISGESRWINGGCALDHLHRLRAAVDAVVIGAGTALADDPLLTVRRAPGRSPARVVIDPTGRAPASLRCFRDDGSRRVSLRAADAPSAEGGVETLRVARGDNGAIAPLAIVAALAATGFPRLLIEGGARTVSAFIDAGAVDRLHVLVAPTIIGSGRIGLDLAPEPRLAAALRPATRIHLFEDGDVLFDCDLRRRRPETAAP